MKPPMPMRDKRSALLLGALRVVFMASAAGLAGCETTQQPYNLPILRFQVDQMTFEAEENLPYPVLEGNVHVSPSLSFSGDTSAYKNVSVSTGGLGRAYADFGQISKDPTKIICCDPANARNWAVIPHFTVARQLEITRQGSDTTTVTNTQGTQTQQPVSPVVDLKPEYLLPGFEAGLHTGNVGWHLSSELYSYVLPSNKVIKAGVSYPVRPNHSPDWALILEQRAWDVPFRDNGIAYHVTGQYQALYVKLIAGGASIGLGGFHRNDSYNAGSGTAAKQASDGVFVELEMFAGLMDW